MIPKKIHLHALLSIENWHFSKLIDEFIRATSVGDALMKVAILVDTVIDWLLFRYARDPKSNAVLLFATVGANLKSQYPKLFKNSAPPSLAVLRFNLLKLKLKFEAHCPSSNFSR